MKAWIPAIMILASTAWLLVCIRADRGKGHAITWQDVVQAGLIAGAGIANVREDDDEKVS